MAADSIRIEVAYATPAKQTILALDLPAGSSAEQAINASGILQVFPEIDLNKQQIGIFGTVCKAGQSLADGDRIEIYRPLAQNPMAARRSRAQK